MHAQYESTPSVCTPYVLCQTASENTAVSSPLAQTLFLWPCTYLPSPLALCCHSGVHQSKAKVGWTCTSSTCHALFPVAKYWESWGRFLCGRFQKPHQLERNLNTLASVRSDWPFHCLQSGCARVWMEISLVCWLLANHRVYTPGGLADRQKAYLHHVSLGWLHCFGWYIFSSLCLSLCLPSTDCGSDSMEASLVHSPGQRFPFPIPNSQLL